MSDPAQAECVRFLAPLPPVRLRVNRRTRSVQYGAALIREYQEQVWCAGYLAGADLPRWNEWAHLCAKGPVPWERAHLVLTWRHHRAGPDADNALASCKPLIDVLKATGPRPLGLVVDDDPAHLSVEIKVEKVKTKAEEGVLVEVLRA